MSNSNYLVLCTMRDEGPYILEWLAYYRAIGATDFLIYTNDCRDGTDLLLDRLAQSGEVTHVRNKVLKRGPQKSAYKAAMQHPDYLDAEWVVVCDVDEFFNIKVGDGHLDDLVAAYPDADAIPVCWRMFSNGGRDGFIDGFTTEALLDAEPDTAEPGAVGRFVKSIFRPRPEIIRVGFHNPVYMDEFEPHVKWGSTWFQNGSATNPRRPTSDFGYEIAQVNHYAVRSIDPFMVKRDRGDGDARQGRLELEYWERWCRGGTEDRSIQRLVPKMREEYARLTADPVVRHLHEGALEWHKMRFKELMQMKDYKALRHDIVSRSMPGVAAGTATQSNPAAEALALKAPKRHQNRLRMLEELPKGGKCAEIGVWNGAFSASILDVTQPSELTLIDPWELLAAQSDEERTHKRHADALYMREMFDNVSDRYGALGNVNIRKGFSAEVMESFPNAYFDWVYIDGNHQYDFVKQDIEIAFRKVRPGGIIAGDDFFWKRDDRMHVREAVLDAMRAHGMTNRPTRIGQQYMITVPSIGGEQKND